MVLEYFSRKVHSCEMMEDSPVLAIFSTAYSLMEKASTAENQAHPRKEEAFQASYSAASHTFNFVFVFYMKVGKREGKKEVLK